LSDAKAFDPYRLPPEAIREPPTTLWGMLRMIGPGIVLAGTIVGSGELLLTTGLGAQYGYAFLWLILLSCVIKVFVQIELGRYAISSGLPTLGAMNRLRGPRLGAHILVWWWLVMMLCTVFQLGAMTGTIGQALNLTAPSLNSNMADLLPIASWARTLASRPEISWAFVTCGVTILLLWSGSYRWLEGVTTLIVIGVTLLTVIATIALGFTSFPVRWAEAAAGLNPTRTPVQDIEALAAAFGVFGITGVGATELFYYPYWCLEKGYARFVGPNDGTEAWQRRARGWIKILHFDAWTSMVVFTLSTVAFYFMGATVLKPQMLNPKGKDMIETLSRMFVDSFGTWTRILFMIGASAVLFKTLYLSCAGNARMTADFFGLAGAVKYSEDRQRKQWIRWLTVLFPIMALGLFLGFKDPKQMLLVGSCAQAATLPMIAGVALYFRYRALDSTLTPSRRWDIVLWVAAILITVFALYAFSKAAYDLWQSIT
jgi:manganese transport protein